MAEKYGRWVDWLLCLAFAVLLETRLPDMGEPTPETKLHKFLANSIVQGVGVLLALGLAFSGRLSQIGTQVCIVLAACVGVFGIWSHSRRKATAVVLATAYVLGLYFFAKFLMQTTVALTPSSGGTTLSTTLKVPTAEEIAEEVAKKVPRQHDVEKELMPAVKVTPNVEAKVGKAGPLNHENPPTLLDLFRKDFGEGVSDQGFDLRSSDGETIHIDRRILLDFAGKNEFVAFYLPSTKHGPESCLALVDLIRPMVSDLPNKIEATGGDSSGITRLEDLTFSGRVFIYHEWPLSNKQKADVIEAYSAKGLDLQFRGLDYLGDKLIAWHQEHDVKAAH